MWTLLIISTFWQKSVDVSHLEGFSTESACIIAGDAVQNQVKAGLDFRTICIRK